MLGTPIPIPTPIPTPIPIPTPKHIHWYTNVSSPSIPLEVIVPMLPSSENTLINGKPGLLSTV